MIEFLTGWITGITAAAVISALVLAIAPECPAKRVLRLACGIIMLVAVLRPVKGLGDTDLSFFLQQYRSEFEGYEEEMSGISENNIKLIIEDRTRTYILQKKDMLRLDCDVAVTAQKPEGEEGYPYPYSVELIFNGSLPEEDKKKEMSEFLSIELGIPPERQLWRLRDGEGK